MSLNGRWCVLIEVAGPPGGGGTHGQQGSRFSTVFMPPRVSFRFGKFGGQINASESGNMTMFRFGDLMASVGEFTDADGKKCKRWLRCGVVMRDDTSGAWSIKLDAVPVCPSWSGWLAVRNTAEGAEMNEPREQGKK